MYSKGKGRSIQGEVSQRLQQIISGKGLGNTEEVTEEIGNAYLLLAKGEMDRQVGWWFLGKMSAKGMGKGINKDLASHDDINCYLKGSIEGKGLDYQAAIKGDVCKGFGKDGKDDIQTSQVEWSRVSNLIATMSDIGDPRATRIGVVAPRYTHTHTHTRLAKLTRAHKICV